MSKFRLLLDVIFNLRHVIYSQLLTCLIFIIVLFLTSVSIEVILYALVLILFFWIILFMYYSYKVSNKHKFLQSMIKQEHFSFDQMIEPNRIIEKDYYDIIEKIHQENLKNQSFAQSRYTNLEDITTLWAHQIKTPISAMRLLLQTNESEDNNELKDELFEIEKYVEMLLGYYRLNSDTNDFVIRRIDCEPIIRTVIRQYAKFFIRKKIQIEVEHLNITVLSDEKWLSFVFEQILSNALKYTNEGMIRIYTEKGHTIVIEDTGIGIQEEDLPRVFEKGYTGYNGRSDKKSTGLGLYLCKMILNKLGHTITINSIINKGTIVRINLENVNLKVE